MAIRYDRYGRGIWAADKLSMIGTRHECQCCGRIARIIDEYNDSPSETGYLYEFESEPGQQRWISTASAAIRFRRIGGDADDTLKALLASQP